MTLGRQDLDLLRELGVSNPDEFASLDAAEVRGLLDTFRTSEVAGSGALVYRLRAMLRSSKSKRATSLLERERLYAEEIGAWLEAQLPDVCDPKHGPHPAAVAAVIRLHHEHGRGLTRSRHGSRIRAFVRAWEERLLEPADRWFCNSTKGNA